MVEADHFATVRVKAPVETVWDEVSTIERLVGHIPEVAWFKVEPDGRTAQLSTRLAWGPVRWKVATATLEEAHPPHRLRWSGQAPFLHLNFDGVFELTPAAGGAETQLSYRGAIRCDHRLIGRLRGPVVTYLEAHVNGFATHLAALAAQHAEAERRLSFPPPDQR